MIFCLLPCRISYVLALFSLTPSRVGPGAIRRTTHASFVQAQDRPTAEAHFQTQAEPFARPLGAAATRGRGDRPRLPLADGDFGRGQRTITYSYDARGRLVQVARTGSVNNGVTTSYTLDKADNRTAKTTTGSANPPPP